MFVLAENKLKLYINIRNDDAVQMDRVNVAPTFYVEHNLHK